MSITTKLAAAAVIACGAVAFASGASAAEVYIAGSIYWDPVGSPTPAPTTLYSAPNEIANFSFDVNQALPNTSPSATGVDVINFQYSLNNVAVVTPLSAIVFWNPANNGMFDIDFNDGQRVSIYGANIGNIDSTWLIGPPGAYPVTAAIDGGLPATGEGAAVIAVSAVPLPAGLPLFGAGLAALGAFAGFKRTRKAA
jgi:hypothetical protein